MRSPPQTVVTPNLVGTAHPTGLKSKDVMHITDVLVGYKLHGGKIVTGLVVEETPDVIKLVENPLIKTDPIVIKRGDVVDRQKSKTSIMPKGLLDKLTKDEILDLIAYVNARGNKNHELFQHGGHDHK